MIISFLLVGIFVRWRMSRRARILPFDIKMLRSRLHQLGERVKSATATQGSVKFAVGLNSSLVYLKQKRGGMTVVVGDAFLRTSSENEFNGILAQELAHIGHFRKKRALSILTKEILAVQVISFVIPQMFIVIGFVFAMWLLLAMRMSWMMEYQADKEAAAILDPGTVIMGLKRLGSLSLGGVSTSHPSLSSRIAKLSAEFPSWH
jgi:Zn-dependent protease with chaperone function